MFELLGLVPGQFDSAIPARREHRPPRSQIEAGDVSGLAVGPKRQAEEVARCVVAGEAAHGQGVLAGHQRQAIVVGVGPRDIAGGVDIRDPSNAERLVHREPANLVALGAQQLRQCAGAQPGGDDHGRGADSLAVAEDHRIGSDTCDAGAGSRLDAGGTQGFRDKGARVVAEIAADDVGSIDQYDLGRMYEKGQGVPQDYAEALRWIRLAADQGHPGAQRGLGRIYHEGRGMPGSYAQAMKWWRMDVYREGQALYEAGQFEQAIPAFRKALELGEREFGPDHRNTARLLNNLAKLYADLGRYDDAEPLYKRALDIKEQALGREHPDVATSLNNLAVLYSTQGRYADAEPLYKRALAIREKALGPDDPAVAQSLSNLAKTYRAQGGDAEADQLLERGPPTTASAVNIEYCLKGAVAVTAQDHDLAIEHFSRCIDEGNLGNDQLGTAFLNRGASYGQTGQPDSAIRDFDAAIRLKPDYPRAFANRAYAYETLGQHEIALGDYKKAYDLGDRSQQMVIRLARGVLLSLERYAALLRKTGNDAKAMEIDQGIVRLRQSWNSSESGDLGFDPSETLRDYAVLLSKHGREADGKRMGAFAGWYQQFNFEQYQKAVKQYFE